MIRIARMSSLLSLLFAIIFLTSISTDASNGPQLAVPSTLANEVSNYVISSPKIFTGHQGYCDLLRPEKSNTIAPDATIHEPVQRVSLNGADPRDLNSHTFDSACPTATNSPDQTSNIVVDDNYIYWVSNLAGGLVRIPIDNVGGAPELVGATAVANNSQIVLVGDYVYKLTQFTGLRRIHKSTGANSSILSSASAGTNSWNLKTDGTHLYWTYTASGQLNLRQRNINSGAMSTIVSDISGYQTHPFATGGIYYFEDNVVKYRNNTGSIFTLLTRPSANKVVGFAVESPHFFWVEQLGSSASYALYRAETSDVNSPVAIVTSTGSQMLSIQPFQRYLYYVLQSKLYRIHQEADSVALSNLKVTDIEINQAIQSDTQSVDLIRGKRTGVRVHVESDSGDIDGVYARLYRINAAGTVIDGPLAPLNVVGSIGTVTGMAPVYSPFIKVKADPNKDAIEDAFLFLLPPEWTDDATLRVRAELNPNSFPLESNQADNQMDSAMHPMLVSPRFEANIVRWEFEFNDTRWAPEYRADILHAYSWIRRAYPLDSSVGSDSTPGVGFRPNLRWVYDESLGARVDRTHEDCTNEFCAAWYVNGQMATMKNLEDIPSDEFFYGMISDRSPAQFPRGWASGTESSGPAGDDIGGSSSWDWDGTYGDWYAAHEIGHSAGRAHPTGGNGCGHSASDDSYPWPGSAIGDSTYRGLDVGQSGLNVALFPRVYDSANWADVMGYCTGQWISEYTFEGIYSALTSARPARTTSVAGEHLQINGAIDGTTVHVTHVRVWPTISTTPPAAQSGQWELRQYDGSSLLATDPVQGEDNTHANMFAISMLVPYKTDATRIEIVESGSGTVLWRQEVSSNAPSVSNVSYDNATNIVSWSATDADGDSLGFDIMYSIDNGANYQMLHMGIDDDKATVDPDLLAASQSAKFKVIAHDDMLQGSAESPAYFISAKPPQVYVVEPADGATYAYGQTVLFSAETFDIQDGSIDDNGIFWTDHTGATLGTGATFATSNLKMGANVITARAINGWQLMGEQKFTIYVQDEVEAPEAAIVVGPKQVIWHVSQTETGAQTKSVSVTNAGSGELSALVATENADWLSVSLDDTQTPTKLNLIAQPPQLDIQPTDTAVVKLSSSSGKTFDLMVTLNRGPVVRLLPPTPPTGAQNTVFLPVLVR